MRNAKTTLSQVQPSEIHSRTNSIFVSLQAFSDRISSNVHFPKMPKLKLRSEGADTFEGKHAKFECLKISKSSVDQIRRRLLCCSPQTTALLFGVTNLQN